MPVKLNDPELIVTDNLITFKLSGVSIAGFVYKEKQNTKIFSRF